jgi:membrane protein implicated in regulation of membrane protease activity
MMGVLGWATLRRLLDIRWWAVLALLLAAGFIAGAGWWVMTAGVIGANIGAGWVIISGGPILLMLLVWALAISVYLWSRAGHARKKPVSRPDTG